MQTVELVSTALSRIAAESMVDEYRGSSVCNAQQATINITGAALSSVMARLRECIVTLPVAAKSKV
jgi:hypothetical protein